MLCLCYTTIGVSASFGHHPLAMVIDNDDSTCSSLSLHPNTTLVLLPHVPSSTSAVTHHGHVGIIGHLVPPVPRFSTAVHDRNVPATATPPSTPSTVTLHI
jgi:hypothetical protein